MAKINECLKAAKRELEQCGVKYDVRFTKRHIHLTYAGLKSVMPTSPSDWRAALNTRADVRRKLRAAGLLKGADQ